MRYTLRSKTHSSMTVSSVGYMLRPKKYLNKAVLHEVEDTVKHDRFLCEVHAEVEEIFE
jgi:hypothetical protein